jgi:hypothetical protein
LVRRIVTDMGDHLILGMIELILWRSMLACILTNKGSNLN